MNAKPVLILIIESDAAQSRLLQEALRGGGYELRSASTGWEAQKILRAERPDLIVASIRLPDMDGTAIRDDVLLDPAMKDAPFLFLTESGDVEQEIEALRSRVDDFIEKPFNPVVLVERVKAVLARRAAYEEMVRVDPLTRLLRRQSLEQELANQMQRALRGRMDCAIFVDPADIGALNQQHGWTMGDLMLTCLAGIICTKIRNEDVAGRLGEDRFILYLPHTPVDGARVLFERIDTLAASVSSAISGIQIGLNAAILEVPADADAVETLLKRGQEALDAGKKVGKHQLTIWRDIQAPA